MLRIKPGKRKLLVLALCVCMGACAFAPVKSADDKEGSQEEKKEGLTIRTEGSDETLYTDALKTPANAAQKFTTVRRGDFITTTTVGGTVVYPKQERIHYDFPYGETYYLEAVGVDTPNKKAGDAIASIYVQMDELQMAVMERQLQRMEERGETDSSAYAEMQETLSKMQEALTKTEIVMEEDGVLLEQDFPRFGTRISSYTIVVADPSERLLEVPNENNQFRYGQMVKVSAKINGVTKTGTGKVMTASSGTVSADLTGTTAYIRLDADSEYLYDGTGISVTAETVHMEDVLLLDVSAAYMENGVQMVKVKDEHGLHAVSFSFGRKNASTYWVIDGLEEGAQILVQ